MTEDRYRDWDASYLLDALSRAERAEYEDHLTGCDACRQSVAELAGMSALLGRAKPEDVTSLLEATSAAVPPGVLDRMAELAATPPEAPTPTRRSAWWKALALAAVLVIVVAAGIIVQRVTSPAPPPPQPVAVATASADPDSPIRASVALYAEPWGTRVEMTCSYDATGRWAKSAGKRWVYTMVVVSVDSTTSQIAKWTVDAGATAHPSGTTDLAPDRIKAIEIRSARGTVLVTIPIH